MGNLPRHHPGALLELFEVNDVAGHFPCGEMVKEAEHAMRQQPVLPTAQLSRHDDPGMGPASRLPLPVERCEVANIVRQDGPTFLRREGELLFVGGRVEAGFLGR